MLNSSKVLVCFAAVGAVGVVACSSPQNDAITDTSAVTGDRNGGPSVDASCLDKDPIDATQYPYTTTRPAMPGSCTTANLEAFTQYYKDHVSDADLLTGWKNSVPAACSACIFSNATDAAWAPVILMTETNGSSSFDVNPGGCIEEVSHNEACGRAYGQFQKCTIEACLKDCHTQAEFTKCRQDSAVLTTSCKDSLEAIHTACGSSIGPSERACKGTKYTFEGPIKVLCVGP